MLSRGWHRSNTRGDLIKCSKVGTPGQHPPPPTPPTPPTARTQMWLKSLFFVIFRRAHMDDYAPRVSRDVTPERQRDTFWMRRLHEAEEQDPDRSADWENQLPRVNFWCLRKYSRVTIFSFDKDRGKGVILVPQKWRQVQFWPKNVSPWRKSRFLPNPALSEAEVRGVG